MSDVCFETYQRKLSCSLKFDKCHVVSLMLTLRRLRAYLMCIREHEDHKFLQYISGVDSKEVFQLVHRHESADLKARGNANINKNRHERLPKLINTVES